MISKLLKKILTSLLNKLEDKDIKELRKISNKPRYTKGDFFLDGKKITYPDVASFRFMYKELFIKNNYLFKSEIQNPFIIDCGANIGMSIIYFKKIYPACEIVAFEPEKNIFKYLTFNLASFGLNNVKIYNKALWNEETILKFSNEGADANRISLLNKETCFQETYDVQTVRLSSFINRTVDLLKIDIEGAEVEIIKEIRKKLFHVKRIFIEYHSFEKGKQELDVILEILSREGFHYYIDSPDRMKENPFVDKTTFLSFDCFLNIYAFRE